MDINSIQQNLPLFFMSTVKDRQILIKGVGSVLRDRCRVQPGERLVVATSGGIDSTALLHLLAGLDLELSLVAVYVDHGLRPEETPGEIEMLGQLTASLAIPFLVRTIDVRAEQRAGGMSLEEAARRLRYRCLEEVRGEVEASAIAVGHTADDQVEELYIRLIRGTGLKGLTGMGYRQGRVIRPLLGHDKASLADYLASCALPSCLDSSNHDQRFLRNRVRSQLLPLLEAEFNPAIRRTSLQTMAILGEDEDLLAQLSQAALNELAVVEETDPATDRPRRIAFEPAKFAALHIALQRRVLESLCRMMDSRPTFRQIETIRQMIGQSGPAAEFHLGFGLRLHRREERIVLLAGSPGATRGKKAPPPACPVTELGGPGVFYFAELARSLTITKVSRGELGDFAENCLYCNADLLHFPLVLRPPRPGEKIQPLGAPGHKKISRILTDRKIAAASRHLYPVLSCDDQPIAIVGLVSAEHYRISTDCREVLVISWR